MRLIAVTLVLGALLGAQAFYEASGPVLQPTSAADITKAISDGQVLLTEFYAPWCDSAAERMGGPWL